MSENADDIVTMTLMSCETCDGKGYLPFVDPNGEPNPKTCPDCAALHEFVSRIVDQRIRQALSDQTVVGDKLWDGT